MKQENIKRESAREALAERFISLLEESKKSHRHWTQGWSGGIGSPYNGMTNQKYHGINRLVLMIAAAENGWEQNSYYSYKQANDMGYSIKSGEKATRIEYWMAWDGKEKKSITIQEMEQILKNDANRKETEFTLFPKAYYVFNGSQIKGLEPPKVEKHDFDENELAEQVINVYCENTGVGLRFGGNQAYYKPSEDYIQLPAKSSFHSPESYYSTALHEIVHSTAKRLNRPLSSFSADHDSYAIEELRAEIASTFLCGDIGIKMSDSVIENHQAYVSSWLSQIKQDHSILFECIKSAEAAASYVLDISRFELMKEKIETYAREPKGLEGKKIELWQMSDADYNNAILFAGFSKASQYSLTSSRYIKQWEGFARPEDKTLEDIFMRFNVNLSEVFADRPEESPGLRSMSVSDVLVVNDESGRHAYYCDIVGFKELPGFFRDVLQKPLVMAL